MKADIFANECRRIKVNAAEGLTMLRDLRQKRADYWKELQELRLKHIMLGVVASRLPLLPRWKARIISLWLRIGMGMAHDFLYYPFPDKR